MSFRLRRFTKCLFAYIVSSPNVCLSNGQFAYYVSFPVGYREGEHALGGWLGKARLEINTLLVKEWLGKQILGKMAVGESTILRFVIVGETTLGKPS